MKKSYNNIMYLLNSRTFKMAASATISVFIANYSGLKFGVTAGVISILSILNTKKEALRVGGRRLLAALLAIIISFALYEILGNSPWVFGIFLIIFIPITTGFAIEEGLVMGAVLSTHLLTSTNIDATWIINEIAVALIGIGVAMIFNLYSPSLEDEYKKCREEIESRYRTILYQMSTNLLTNSVSAYEDILIDKTEDLLRDTKSLADSIRENSLFKDENYYTNYIEMRIMQFECIKRMKKHFSRSYMQYEHTRILSSFTQAVAKNLTTDNDCVDLINDLYNLKEEYKKMELPKTREEFENRALLFQFLNDLEDFLIIKRDYKLIDN
ncbi:MAG: aromatic acid exporter family protein [Clostridium sp.]|nr:aromatic acid exporter family protein [Clostridium sp.]